jgi:hypothetical protein
VSVRPHYSFIDVADEAAERLVEVLGGESQLFVRHAITLNAPREHEPEAANGHHDAGDRDGSEEVPFAEAASEE